MNLEKLFETQAKLDEHIYVKHPELRGQDNLDWKILALQVELGECANEWRGFKKWSNDQEPRIEVGHKCDECNGSGLETGIPDDGKCRNPQCCDGTVWRNPLLEEYVDCLSFILTIGLELGVALEAAIYKPEGVNRDITKQFSIVFSAVADLSNCIRSEEENYWWEIYEEFCWLGILLGFDWEQIQQAYYAKNKINHERQESGY